MPRVRAVNRRYRHTRPSFKPQGIEEKYEEYLRSIRSPLSYLGTLDICDLCAMTIIQIAKDGCCQSCFERWLYLEDDKKCALCEKPLKDVLTKEQADKFCERVGLKWKRLTSFGHFTNCLTERRIYILAQKTSN